ncbi:hypothetical protein ASF58_06810 [Methylobacterium sp. Leaf125]|uniref:hypothetical protein n=1 Tax=Methylobacterium sp. Leaf125 TaxID=1736265 RepID=UPI0006FB1106|nr:hypothetical protein [Methylobacterium sp. Leaf125]KQQ41191.1 hypothetical protein ASF58_06810 [Methylobacterium sp. Leaf125]
MSRPLPVTPDSPISSPDASRFVIGRDGRGCWVALEVHGRAGGLFRTCQAALNYAVEATAHRPDSVRIAADRIELRI